jgi:hypothetical protein
MELRNGGEDHGWKYGGGREDLRGEKRSGGMTSEIGKRGGFDEWAQRVGARAILAHSAAVAWLVVSVEKREGAASASRSSPQPRSERRPEGRFPEESGGVTRGRKKTHCGVRESGPLQLTGSSRTDKVHRLSTAVLESFRGACYCRTATQSWTAAHRAVVQECLAYCV